MNVKTPIRPAVRLVMYLLSTDSSEAVCALNGNPVPVDEPPRQKVEELLPALADRSLNRTAGNSSRQVNYFCEAAGLDPARSGNAKARRKALKC
jgi:hypothetical protein